MASPLLPAGYTRCGLLRRLAAITYDLLLLVALIFIAAFAALPVTGGEAVRPQHPVYMSYLFLVCFGFFAWFWTHGGQTLGMRAWRVRVVDYAGNPIGLWHSLLRFLAAIVSWAPGGLGFLWSQIDGERQAWHDRFSGTQLIVLPKRQKADPQATHREEADPRTITLQKEVDSSGREEWK